MNEILGQILDRSLGQVEASVDLNRGEPLVGQTGNVELFETRNGFRIEDLPDPIVSPSWPFATSDIRHLEVPL